MISHYKKASSDNLSSYSTNTTSYKDSLKTVEKAMIDHYESLKSDLIGRRIIDRESVLRVLKNLNQGELAAYSNRMYKINTTYYRLVEYFAGLLCWYWMVTPLVFKSSQLSAAVKEQWWNVLQYIENINPEKLAPEIARRAILEGACYIAVKEKKGGGIIHTGIQYLPIEYCRSTKSYDGRDLVDFNVKYFDEKFSNPQKKAEALSLFPDCVSSEYFAYKGIVNKKTGDEWRTLDANNAFRFTVRKDQMPLIFGVILDILDLQDSKDITMFQLEQRLSKIIIQQFPLDKNGEAPIATLEEMQAYHRDVNAMVEGIPGLELITTYADIDVQDVSQLGAEAASNDPAAKTAGTVYTAAGVSGTLFNADNSGALAKSVIVDEDILFTSLLPQIQEFLNIRVRNNFQKGDFKNIDFRVYMPQLTFMNRESMAKLYKEQVSLGYSKFLPAIALGQRQSFIFATLIFENNYLDLNSYMIPPNNSNTMSSSQSSSSSGESGGQVGRPTLSDEEQSEKTRQNRESL